MLRTFQYRLFSTSRSTKFKKSTLDNKLYKIQILIHRYLFLK
ncbi:unnamed protein product [Chironomus riparius]|uniref:Uncharacterized protein n=1 Tax=Chironomus riparius TaxID=315576 RepID=A0A9N9RKJ2_9DIPT|nr:unnamed protein product [Chironomus riparius]